MKWSARNRRCFIQQDTLQVGHCSGEGHLMNDDDLPHHVVDVVTWWGRSWSGVLRS